MIKINVDFSWCGEQAHYFHVLKNQLTQPSVLTMFYTNKDVTELHTDTSLVGLGAMLLQSRKTSDQRYCASKKNRDNESKYHSSKWKLMCVV